MEEHEPPADRTDRDVDSAVVVVVGGSEPTPVQLAPAQQSGVDPAPVAPREDLDRRGILPQARDRDRPIGYREVERTAVPKIDPRVAPPREIRPECAVERVT